jgi:hypothetical protein
MPGRSHRGPLPALDPEQQELARRLRHHVDTLGSRIGERHLQRPRALAAARAYVVQAMTDAGLQARELPYRVGLAEVANVEAVLPGRREPREIVVVGAHYDSALGSPGANDNASGVAAVIELGRLLRDRPRERELRLVAFVNEEPPWFQTPAMGSLVYARALVTQGAPVVAMLTPETVGYYSDARGSQRYPRPFDLFYPDTGNFIGFIGNLASLSLLRRCVGSFRRCAAFPSEGAAVPASIDGVAWSDHWAFWQQGVPALMVTDTAPYRDPHYHTAQDAPEHVDTDRLARVVSGLVGVVEALLSARGR